MSTVQTNFPEKSPYKTSRYRVGIVSRDLLSRVTLFAPLNISLILISSVANYVSKNILNIVKITQRSTFFHFSPQLHSLVSLLKACQVTLGIKIWLESLITMGVSEKFLNLWGFVTEPRKNQDHIPSSIDIIRQMRGRF